MIGVDILEVARIKKAIKNTNFCKRVFTENELEYAKQYKNFASHLAGFFCSIEAVMKALVECTQLSFLDIDVCYNASGKPFIILYKKAKKLFENKNYKNIEISISQTENYATAFCLIN